MIDKNRPTCFISCLICLKALNASIKLLTSIGSSLQTESIPYPTYTYPTSFSVRLSSFSVVLWLMHYLKSASSVPRSQNPGRP